MDIRKRFPNSLTQKMLIIVGISTIGDGFKRFQKIFFPRLRSRNRIFRDRNHISHSDFRNQEYKKLRFNGNSDTLKSKLFKINLEQDTSQTGYITNRRG